MRRTRGRLLAFLLAIPILIVVLATLYQLGMRHLEGQERNFFSCLQWAAETVTTTGYGHDSHWTHPLMIVLVVSTQFAGVFLAVLLIPLVLVPYLEERFEGRLPSSLPRVRDAVVIYKYGPPVSQLVQALDRARVPVIILEDDLAAARRLYARGRKVVMVDLDEEDPDLRHLQVARAVVLNGEEHRNAVLALCARQQGFTGTIVALIDDPHRRNPMVMAGATAAFTPSHVLGAAVAGQASARINPRVAGAQQLGHLEIAELRVHKDSPLAGKTLAESRIRSQTGANILGLWQKGQLTATLEPSTVLPTGAIVVAAGSHDSIRRLSEMTHPLRQHGHLLVLGHGEVGHKVAELLRDVGEQVTVVDRMAGEGVDVVGDALRPEILREARIADARAVVVALGNDGATLFASTLIRDLAAHAAIIAVVKRAENVRRIHRAGADFALSVSRVAGQLLAAKILKEESVSLESALKVVKVAPGALVGKNPIAARIRESTGCSIVAVGRGDDFVVDVDESFVLEAGDAVYIAGAPDAVQDYFNVVPGARGD